LGKHFPFTQHISLPKAVHSFAFVVGAAEGALVTTSELVVVMASVEVGVVVVV